MTKLSQSITSVELAIQAIVTYRTLPSQIDYTKPYQKRADRGLDFIESLGSKEQHMAIAEIDRQVFSYYEPNEGLNGHSISGLSEMF